MTAQHETYAYDAADRRLTSTNVDGLTLTYTYDGLGREMHTHYPDGHDRRTRADLADGGHCNYTYDAAAQLTGGKLLAYVLNSPAGFFDPRGEIGVGAIIIGAGAALIVSSVALEVYDHIVVPVQDWFRDADYCSGIECWAASHGLDLMDLSGPDLSPARKAIYCNYWRECQGKDTKITVAVQLTVGATSVPGVTPGGSPILEPADVISGLILMAASQVGADESDVTDTGDLTIEDDSYSMHVTVMTNAGLQSMCGDGDQ